MSNLLFNSIPLLVSGYMKLVYKTELSRKTINIEPIRELYKKKKPFIYAFWHNRIFMAPFGLPEYIDRYVPIISKSKDGELIARTVEKLGVKAFARGSSSKYGNEAFKSGIRHLREKNKGYVLAITPDGPLGPKYVLKDGVVKIAMLTGCPVVCFSYNCSKKIVANSWDNFIIPLPCSDFIYAYHEPFFIDRKKSVEENKKIVENALKKVTKITDNWEF